MNNTPQNDESNSQQINRNYSEKNYSGEDSNPNYSENNDQDCQQDQISYADCEYDNDLLDESYGQNCQNSEQPQEYCEESKPTSEKILAGKQI